ncbi:conserved hypothetical protein [Tenacibaculum sp. 190524A02b]|uniref:Uncharacterized protein n=1 Tax=Tenacibaculum vairaonense TaxID=3137860 RepID=A0ABP1FCU5_9FLAO
MQAKMKDGSWNEVQDFNEVDLKNLLGNPKVEKVEVFNATPEELKKRKKKFKTSRGFKKAPRIK